MKGEEDQKSAINNIKTRNESREKIVKLFDDIFQNCVWG